MAKLAGTDLPAALTHAETFSAYRPLLFSIAYRMLGSVMDAEDIVQEAYLRWQSIARSAPEVESPKAYLSAVVTRLSIDQLRAARTQRETYIGTWLPEPLATPDDAELQTERAEALSFAFLTILERLTPTERAVFLLHDVFEYDYAEIARMVEKREATCRQLARRARQALAAHKPRFAVSPEQHQRMFMRFVETCAQGDMEGLLALLAPDAAAYGDGGGKVRTALNVIRSNTHVARYLIGLAGKLPPNIRMQIQYCNHQPALVIYDGNNRVDTLLLLDVDAAYIRAVYVLRNPDKLRHIQP